MGIVINLFMMALQMTNTLPINQTMDEKANLFIREHESLIKPLEISSNLAWWEANTTGSKDAFEKKEKAQNKMDQALADNAKFARLKSIYSERKSINDPTTARCIEILYLQYLEKQVPLELLAKSTSLSNKVEKAFNEFRPVIASKEVTENEVRSILKASRDSNQRKEAWEASKNVGPVLEKNLIELVKTRNQIAKHLGFSDFHKLQLFINEQNTEDLMALFDRLDELTKNPFEIEKQKIDQKLAELYGVQVKDLLPWHYQDPFFQEAPAVFGVNLDAPFKKADLLGLSRDFYQGIGLPIDRVITASDLYEKKGKSPHAFCTDIDRSGDVRVLANIKQDDYWASTLLHEFGHAVYSSRFIPESLPYVLRGEAHILATEGVAMMFERLTKRSAFLVKMGLPVEDPKKFDESAAMNLRHRLLIFSRWCQVMLRFEKAMYENPDQNLNELWWKLVSKYQGINKPTGRNMPDYASKIHIVSAPVYYHNYMLGELFASQLHHSIVRQLYAGKNPDEVFYAENPKVGDFMKTKVFNLGRTLSWGRMVEFATGSPLAADSFAKDFQGK